MGDGLKRARAAARATQGNVPPPDPFSFCESVAAGGSSPWHIRKLDGPRKLGGGITAASLCGRVKVNGGWDLAVLIDEHHLTHTCRECVEAYRKVKHAD